ncbi:hypothetical protein PAPYR_4995 [Paratrimastix pyriformis]|uniref:Vacuolar ATPase assembly integral membrane protein VMA21 homolog n=1 Tax=Paratrimastix pyriformis TaxID=342808 RepID=A0ABQ8UIY3_9EUKA|nr:hypothetical protein PAPYR_4995 [Paratrimastix pyriformis]
MSGVAPKLDPNQVVDQPAAPDTGAKFPAGKEFVLVAFLMFVIPLFLFFFVHLGLQKVFHTTSRVSLISAGLTAVFAVNAFLIYYSIRAFKDSAAEERAAAAAVKTQ